MPRADLTWTPQGTPGSARFGDIYYSRDDGLAESRFVFLEGNDLPRRWRDHPRDTFVIGETGFGTGLNFLLAWQAWKAAPLPRPRLHFLSLEQYPLRAPELRQALAHWPELAPFAAALQDAYPPPVPGVHRLQFEGGAITLDLWWAEAGEALADLRQRGLPLVDAWFLDGFAPARNAGMWQEALLGHLGKLSQPGATLATFTAAGAVRRALQASGFAMRKGPGFGRKRERLLGRLERPAERTLPAGTPWDLPETRSPAPRSALVIGAGLAGCATAAAFARRGIPVTLVERGRLAGAASGNAQGMLYTRLSRRHSALTDFALLSFVHASRTYAAMFAGGELESGRDGELCGSFHQHRDREELDALAPLLADTPELAQVLEAAEASARLGVEQQTAGYWFPGSGWMSPAALCQAWTRREGVTLIEDCGDATLRRSGGQWQALGPGGELLATADCAVIACAGHSAGFEGLDWLPLQAIRGQTTQLPAGPPFNSLRTVLCHAGYIAPATAGGHCIGATFNLGDDCVAARAADHRHNLDTLGRAVPAWAGALAELDAATLEGRVAFRCTTPDYLPLAGPAPDLGALTQRFAGLRQNARRDIPHFGAFVPGLYLNIGHGSRGLTSTPLAAELVASLACGEPPPLDRHLARALAPARFPIRDLGRNRL
ncbi:bifunctional tRNA (5-methylaminomethyl-2-thiouridine)(34)-methyltransferase MnmD/FAD-dependent 5-carboxymethylaminomethyl-2-thiouridine(34) oxidoreductase MnmC [Parahaliea mediterranea]|uniref:tRNA 5-methylaminomethyl-2-thiouridine biosynthesis bifunctional protein MnmC n=1 Tax=Parahaliea mediterranea TaxID=651086 RepID=A0A939DEC7_9GAMM|nr:bifunctional tRNA (5-methylaminomethyl-2-thiouridine)(34)-methyltransferase MnmD/FAD-dependent 5-carboxymethylaminomethyl-2-thiouridine(34) oxidoreductase MnmC [Parahaliea mediterranea]MBN7796688.1 bifunctional tRNA (5-methylaminomethyl-2-thiouridine)(34)-methyltransferase MnmD/FAD-dependent 5-carboxymethylaminomethyl-2-thiouridine(34) oxidoreductase MnmC [Parahaliea mediterranea]